MHRISLLLLPLLPALFLLADDGAKPYTPKVALASDEPARAVKGFRVPEGMQIDLWAAEPMLANPVIFCIDHQNRFYVAETFRLHAGVTDIRGIMSWLDDDLACRTVEDRLAMMKRRLGKKFDSYGVHHERIRLIEDTKGEGKADRAVVFADGFNRPQDGIAAGLLARGKDVWYACIPDLWLLRDTKGTGKANERKVLSTGYGIHIGFIGHDLHGLVMGPDGKIYFSIGDRGLNVKTKEGRHLFHPDTGAVLRCNPDGSELEVFATGLRNPQELAFDKHGNLFTGDNNSDGGDRARWVYLVEGGDSGWRIGYQFGGSQSNRGPWNAEKLWHPQHAGQAAWHIPPLANFADGPSGLTYYPGVGLNEKYDDHFFLADFRGANAGSGIRAFTNTPKGAGFELSNSHQFLWNVLTTDVDFGTDGAMYVSDWVNGWGLTGKGRIWRISDPKSGKSPAVAEVKKLLAAGFDKSTPAELKPLLAHADRRVRQESQFALATREQAGLAVLADVVRTSKATLARLHGLWGLGQMAHKNKAALDAVRAVLADEDAEVRAQAAKVLGESKDYKSAKPLIERLKDDTPRVRFFAAQALAKFNDSTAVPAVLALLRDNKDEDVYIRHAAVRVLTACADADALAAAAKDASVAVRRAVVLAYRHQGRAEVASLLNDADADIVLEAARAINDEPVIAATRPLAALITKRGLSEPLGFRVLNANFILGGAENAKALAEFAARPGETAPLRVEAVKMLEMWEKPPGRDRIMGTWRTPPTRSASIAADAFKASHAGIFRGPSSVLVAAARTAVKLGVKDIGPALFATVADANQPPEVRAETLRGLAALRDESVSKAVTIALADKAPRLRAEGRRVLAKTDPDAGLKSLEEVLMKGTILEQQHAYDVLGEMKGDKAQELLSTCIDNLLAGKVPAEARLDLIEAAEKHKPLAKKVAQYEKARPKDEPFGQWRDTMVGGDAEAGRQVFLNKAEVSCLRCHKAGGAGTGEVGPDLSGIAAQQKRDYLLESIILPSKAIAKGYETVELVLDNGQVRSGILKAETDKEVRLMTPEGQIVVVAKGKIEERRTGKSAMPEDLIKHLSRREMRDLIEFLASLKEKK